MQAPTNSLTQLGLPWSAMKRIAAQAWGCLGGPWASVHLLAIEVNFTPESFYRCERRTSACLSSLYA